MNKHKLNGYLFGTFLASIFCMNSALAAEIYQCDPMNVAKDVPMFESDFIKSTDSVSPTMIPIAFTYKKAGTGSQVTSIFGNPDMKPVIDKDVLISATGTFKTPKNILSSERYTILKDDLTYNVNYTLERQNLPPFSKLVEKEGPQEIVEWELTLSKTIGADTYTSAVYLRHCIMTKIK